MAAQYGEWFYYNGKKLIFGVPEEEELSLTYNIDLKEYHLALIPQAQNYKFYTNDYLTDETHEKDAKEYTSGANGFHAFVANKSAEIFNKETKVYYNLYNDPQSKNRFESGVEIQKKSIEINQVRLSGLSDNPGVKVGGIVVIEGSRYRVVQVSHSSNEIGDYQNQFEAITAEFDAYPRTNIHAFPRSGSQSAIVMENADPDALGRIRVQFPWQKDMSEMTPWIRIVTPHAGGDKGFHFIPEIGEEVLIGFEGDNAERPYMMGSLYHGSANPAGWKTDNNDIKAIRTRSGNQVVMNDKDGSITISDPSGNVVVMQGNGEMIIKAPNKLSLMSTDIHILAGNSINMMAKPAEDGDGDGIINVTAKKLIDVKVEEETITLESKLDAKLASTDASVNIEAKTLLKLKGEEDVKVDGDKVSIQGGSSIKIDSSDTDIF